MSLQSLPTECISHIFDTLKDNKNLYSCLLVNRHWCRIIIPILYKTPFTRRNQGRNKGQQSKIISTYLSCLNNEEKIHFMNSINNNQIQIPLNNDQLFDYPSYLEEFCNVSLEEKLSHWIILNDISIEQRTYFHIIAEILYPLIIRKSKNLAYLNLINLKTDNFDIPDICTFIAFTPGLTNISRLDFLFQNDSIISNIIKLINIIPSLCNNIQIFNFNFKSSSNDKTIIRKALCGIIENQRDLKKLHLRLKDEISSNIMPTLELHSNHLTHLYFKKLRLNDGVLESLANFFSLKVLGFESCYIICQNRQDHSNSFNKILIDSNFQLEKLYLVENMTRHMTSEVKCLIISYFSKSLKDLILDELNLDIVVTLLNHCSNINRLVLLASEYENNDLYHLLINLNYLKSLTLWHIYDHTIKLLGNYLPHTLLHLGFVYLVCVPYEDFLIDCNIPLESLEINNLIMDSTNSSSSDHFKPISDYIINHSNHLKVIYFGINCDINEEDLERIKDFVNVKLIDNFERYPTKFH
ncbi:hypothetical protein RclHR1_17120004 [Rhizophagus clarus]|uniref:F-box domain-containing protein n=1 Tax=Rhizophagus clarus TaxID=94130 RepID=A0A2Z6QKP8_9GLOM|nr:hypothetical protein RclHR1_17120004 [Rhizophagus clarus]GES79785.1 hypothetical protein GLOIN_2v866766 [Rhizophagus clarus]